MYSKQLLSMIAILVFMLTFSPVDAATMRLSYPDGETFGICELDVLTLSSTPDSSGVYQVIHAQYPSSHQGGEYAGRANSTYAEKASQIPYAGNFVWSQIGNIYNEATQTNTPQPGWTEYAYLEPSPNGNSEAFLQIRYSKNSPATTAIRILVDGNFQASFIPYDQQSWERFASTVRVGNESVEWIPISIVQNQEPSVGETVVLRGIITNTLGAPLANVSVQANGSDNTTTDSDGRYVLTLPIGFTGEIHPTLDGYHFQPPHVALENLRLDQIQDFTAAVGISIPDEFYETLITIDEYNSAASFYNSIGGTKGEIRQDGVNVHSTQSDGVYRIRIEDYPIGYQGAFTGIWNSIVRSKQDGYALDFQQIFSHHIKNDYQGRIKAVLLELRDAIFTGDDQNLSLKIELKRNGEILRDYEFELEGMQFPTTIKAEIDSDLHEVDEINWVLCNAKVGDQLFVDAFRLAAEMPVLPTEEESFVWTFANLMNNFNHDSGLFADRANFPYNEMSNISATGKACKLIALAFKKGVISEDSAVELITKSAATLLYQLPQGPGNLWPHFTKDITTPISEWSSLDTIIAALDLITALQIIKDLKGVDAKLLTDAENFIKTIDYDLFLTADGFFGHGFDVEGELIPHVYEFGSEVMALLWAYASSTGDLNGIHAPSDPDQLAPGFIIEAQYPLAIEGKDRWGFDWDVARSKSQALQINWYCEEKHFNDYFCSNNLFGLSAAETPEGDGYVAYGTQDETLNDIVTPHYSAMISRYQEASKQMWLTLRDADAPFLNNGVFISPLNVIESMRVKQRDVVINYMKGSWNLALSAEGYALADPLISQVLKKAVEANEFLHCGYALIKPENSSSDESDGDEAGGCFIFSIF